MRVGLRSGLVAIVMVMLCRGAVGGAADSAGLMVATIAGTGEHGFSGDGGPARLARLDFPLGVAVDGAGNLYIADSSNHRVRKVDAGTGIISTVVGSGQEGDTGDGGPALNAGLTGPMGLALDGAGNLYIGTWTRVRKVDASTGIISTVAGVGTSGFSGDGGPATQAQLDLVGDLALDSSGNIYLVDSFNRRLRRVAAGTGIIETVAGDGHGCPFYEFDPAPPPAPITCMSPGSLAVDRAGTVYFTDWEGFRLRKRTTDGVMTVIAGDGSRRGEIEGDGGPARDARLGRLGGIVIDGAGDIVVVDSGSLREISAATGRISTIAGRVYDGGSTPDGQPVLNAALDPTGLAIDAAGRLYLPEAARVRTFVPNTHDRPLVGDMDGDHRADLVVWRPGTGTWYWLTSSSGFQYATAHSVQWGAERLGDVPLLGDVDGDGQADLIIWRASTGTWYWLTSSSGYNTAAAGSKQWGDATQGDIPLVGDLDGDGRADLVVWRASTGTWYWLTSSSGYAYAAAGARQWGSGSILDVPMLGDMDGDGKADLIVWRRWYTTPFTWYWLTSASNYTVARAAALPINESPWKCTSFVADMDGDGRSDLVMWDRSSGQWTWVTAATDFTGPPGSRQFGNWDLLDHPLLGDMDGDGKADQIVWRLSTGTWYWFAAIGGQKQWGT